MHSTRLYRLTRGTTSATIRSQTIHNCSITLKQFDVAMTLWNRSCSCWWKIFSKKYPGNGGLISRTRDQEVKVGLMCTTRQLISAELIQTQSFISKMNPMVWLNKGKVSPTNTCRDIVANNKCRRRALPSNSTTIETKFIRTKSKEWLPN